MKLSALPAHAFRTPAHKRCLSFTFPRDLICFTILTVHWTLSYFLTGWMSHNSPYPSHISASIASPSPSLMLVRACTQRALTSQEGRAVDCCHTCARACMHLCSTGILMKYSDGLCSIPLKATRLWCLLLRLLHRGPWSSATHYISHCNLVLSKEIISRGRG